MSSGLSWRMPKNLRDEINGWWDAIIDDFNLDGWGPMLSEPLAATFDRIVESVIEWAITGEEPEDIPDSLDWDGAAALLDSDIGISISDIRDAESNDATFASDILELIQSCEYDAGVAVSTVIVGHISEYISEIVCIAVMAAEAFEDVECHGKISVWLSTNRRKVIISTKPERLYKRLELAGAIRT